MTASVVLVVHNQVALTRACVESLDGTSVPFELCVVDNGSAPNRILVYGVRDDGALGDGRVFVQAHGDSIPDGIRCDTAGNVWAANNWNDPRAAVEPNPPSRISTWGGGSGLTVIYGVASHVQPPRMGKVRPL